jgi:uncharacterized repeat protein (TIGR01451 family)
MNRPAFLTAALFVLLITALLSKEGGVLILAAPLLFYQIAGLLTQPENVDLKVERSLDPERANPNDLVTVRISIHNFGSDLTEVLVEDVLPEGVVLNSGTPRQIFTLPRGKTAALEYVISAQRGTYHFENVRVEVGNELGTLHYTRFIPAPGQLFIVPNVLRLKYIAIRPRRTRVYVGNIPARVGSTGTEFFGVRNYQPGDSPRSINWRASARHEEIYSNEFQQERAADVGIILDARKLSNFFAGKHSIFDHSVMAVAALAEALLMQGNRVGMGIQGAMLYWTYPAYGKVQRERIMRNLMRAHPEETPAFARLPRLPFGIFPARSQIVLVSPLITDPLVANDLEVLTQWRARGYQVLAVVPDPVSFELSLLPSDPDTSLAGRVVYLERRVALRRLLNAGVQVIEWDVAKPFDQVVGPYLSRAYTGQFIGGMP